MDKFFFKGFKNTIGYLIFKKILFVYILIAIILTSYQIYSELNSSKKEIGRNLSLLKNRYYKEISYSIWFGNTQALTKRLNDIVINNSEIVGISITNTKDEIISLNGLIEQKLSNYSFSKPLENNNYTFSVNPLIKYEFDVLNEIEKDNNKLANITFYTSQQVIFEYTKETIFLILFNIVLSIIIFWILTVYATHKFLTIPLKKLIDGIKSFESHDDEKVAIKLDLKNMRELTILAESFNKMSGKISEDIINLRQLTMIQNQQKKALEEANRTKDDFLANMSHELKTPLNSVNLISSVMMKNKEKNLTEKDLKNLKIINNCGNDLLHLITDILDLSKLEAGKMKLDFQMINVKSMFEELNDMFIPQAREKNIDFEIKVDNSLENIYSDKSRLNQIIINLVSNSLKFVHKGGIRLNVNNIDEKIEITVSDDGIGIPEDKLEHIFDRFKQADGSTTRKYGGTGLGLAICKDLINLFDGTIEINSKVNIGTTVTLVIPKNLDNIDNTNIIKAKKEAPLEKLDHEFLFEEVEVAEEEEEKVNILILNSDPICFMGLIIELNKFCYVYQTSNFKDLSKKMDEQSYDLVIIDNDSLSEKDIDKILDLDTKFMLTAKKESIINENIRDKAISIIDKPFDNKKAIEVIKKSFE